ncbi:hypothetical protein CFAM422_000745 [Trichoderma lentiforme]|uniref:Xylose isomerase-like TIM barrel domain-containing protein n=1 Tax=Trichoderma lentiforme TaxID=1567552 RepID=A0A9P4XQZ1_9HYPO|nr:hypothetical protein CFAM422_000745 [Trichoderma lentiforme]
MRILCLRSVWGVDPGHHLSNWAGWFPELKDKGYHGVEVKVNMLEQENDYERLRQICDQLELKISVLAQTSPAPSIVPRQPGLDAEKHLARYREIIQRVKPLRPIVITFQSGQDDWNIEESIKFYEGTIEIDRELGVSGFVCHETHRSRSLFSPWVTRLILEAVPELRLTADFSHWMVVGERLLDDGEDDRTTMEAIVPHVSHIHTRVGTTQATQCPAPTHPDFEQERLCYERLWLSILKCQFEKNDPDAVITFVPEYGPFPYHPFGSIKAYGDVADEEAQRLQGVFKEFTATLM